MIPGSCPRFEDYTKSLLGHIHRNEHIVENRIWRNFNYQFPSRRVERPSRANHRTRGRLQLTNSLLDPPVQSHPASGFSLFRGVLHEEASPPPPPPPLSKL